MRVVKRDGTEEVVYFDKISARVRKLAGTTKVHTVDVGRITSLVVAGMYDGISTSAIDELAAEACVSLLTEHPDYGALAARIVMSNWHKNTSDDVLATFEAMASILDPTFLDHVRTIATDLQAMVEYKKDYDFDYFAIKTLEKIYCARIDGKVMERPQHVYLRVAVALHGSDVKKVKETYKLLSQKKFTHASPTLFNAGLKIQQAASCYLTGTYDSLDAITESWKQIANISKLGGGIGTHVHAVRSKGAPITSTNGTSDGLVPMLRVMNNIVYYVNQSGRRKGSMAVYLSPHHPDVMDFLDLRRPGGDDTLRCRDLFLALWIPDLFMTRVQEDGMWSFFDPFLTPGLDDVYGEDYEALYTTYEKEGKARAVVKARDVWAAIVRSQIESGTPYMLYKDSINRKSNQKNVGVIKSSNLCVAPETTITIRTGTGIRDVPIQSVANTCVEVWNGHEWSNVVVRQTHENQELVKVTVWDAQEKTAKYVECTPYHKFYIKKFGGLMTSTKTADQLQFGDTLVAWRDPRSGTLKKQSVVCVSKTNRRSPTYCFDEPKRHRGIFNGILTGNCSEIVEYTSPDEISVCTLASISLPAFVKSNGTYDFAELAKVTKVVAKNLDRLVDINAYPLEQAKTSNLRHRPIGIGVQGLADVYVLMRYPFDSQQARDLNTKLFATIYYAALEASTELAADHGPYSTYIGSPASQGLLQYDLWGVEPHPDLDWATLKSKIRRFGLRNSLSIACMPTASTAQVLGNNESFEPFTSLLFTRRTLAGEFVLINRYLVDDLLALGLWNSEMKDTIIRHNGSIQAIPEIPESIRHLYKTAWDLSMKAMIDQSADRGPYVCQSQSLNLFVADPTPEKLTSMHFYAWKKGLKTGMYYLRTRPASHAKKITVQAVEQTSDLGEPGASCVMCSG